MSTNDSNIKNWSTTPGSNNSAPPQGAPEGMAPSTVNDIMRQQMADHKAQWLDAEWFNHGDSGFSKVSGSVFKLTGDVTAKYLVGRRVQVFDTSSLYGTITASSYGAPDTSVTVEFDTGSMTASTSAVALSIIKPTNKSLPTRTYFEALLGSAVTNQTGDGTVYTVIFATENFDFTGAYNNATGVFTAPVAGDYQFSWVVALASLGVAHVTGDGVYLSTSSAGGFFSQIANYYGISQSGSLYLSGSAVVKMTAGATAQIKIMISGGAKTVGVGDTGGTRFSGKLLA